jgi:hypothetical protein
MHLRATLKAKAAMLRDEEAPRHSTVATDWI